MRRCVRCGKDIVKTNGLDSKCDCFRRDVVEVNDAGFPNRTECYIPDEMPEEDFSDMNDFTTPESFK